MLKETFYTLLYPLYLLDFCPLPFALSLRSDSEAHSLYPLYPLDFCPLPLVCEAAAKPNQGQNNDDTVTDVDYEEVK